MTTTQLYSGLGDKSSSRVLQPPGGGSSNIFGGDDAAPPKQKPAQSHPKDSGIFGSAPASHSSSTKTVANTDNAQTVVESGDSAKTTPTSHKPSDEAVTVPCPEMTKDRAVACEADQSAANVELSPAQTAQMLMKRNQQGTYNPITGESIADKQTPSTRVRQPPGGASSKLW